MDMNDDGSRSVDAVGDSGRVAAMLEARAAAMRNRSGLAQRILLASAPAIRRQSLQGDPASGAWSLRSRWRWSAGLAAAASIMLALFIGVSTQTARPGIDMSLADRVGGEAEPVLVALIAGSEVVEHESPSASELLAAEVMPILRSRDASFRDLDSEIRLVVAGGGAR